MLFSWRPTFTFPGAVFSELGVVIRKLKVSLFIFRDGVGAKRRYFGRGGSVSAILLRLQRDNSLMVVYLGRCPRLYTVALSARVGYSYVVPIIMVEPVWAVPKFLVVGNTHGVACGKSAGGSCNRGSRPLRFPEPSLACWEPSLER